MLILPLETSNRMLGMVVSLPGSYHSPAPKARTSADSWQAEGARLESCCSASSAHGTAHTDAQRLGCLLVLPPQTAKLAWEWGWSQLGYLCTPPPEMRTSAGRWQAEGASLKAVAQPHLSMQLLAQRHRDWGCLLVLPPQTSNVASGVRAESLLQPCSENANVCR